MPGPHAHRWLAGYGDRARVLSGEGASAVVRSKGPPGLVAVVVQPVPVAEERLRHGLVVNVQRVVALGAQAGDGPVGGPGPDRHRRVALAEHQELVVRERPTFQDAAGQVDDAVQALGGKLLT